MNNNFSEMNNVELEAVNGGGVGGAVVGWIFGSTAGICAYTGKAVVTGESSFNGFWKAYTAGGLTGAGVGVWFPV